MNDPNLPITLAAGVLLVALILYTIFAGADFGSGIWTAFAHGKRADQQCDSLFLAIGPIWETNHVWLIFVVVTLFTVFPIGFSALFIALLIPFVIALVGINFRGAAFAFRHFGGYESGENATVPGDDNWQQAAPRLPATALVFSISSLLTPFALGMALTAAASGRIQYVNGEVVSGLWSGWISLFTIVGGLIGVAACAFLTPIYMAVRTEGDLQEDFRRYGMIAALALGILSAVEVPVAVIDAPVFTSRMLHPLTLAFVGAAVVFGAVTLFLLWSRRYFWAQIGAGATITITLLGFGVAMYPDLLIGQLTFFQAAAPLATVQAYLMVLPFGALVLIPSLWFLYRIFLTKAPA